VDRRRFLKLGLGAGAAAFPPLRLAFAGQDARPAPAFQEITPEQVIAINRGLEWLARNQGRSGAIGQTCQVAFTGLGGLAFMAAGSTPTRGKYAANLRGALRFVMRSCAKSGYINESARGMGGSGMHGHGYALLFLCELYGMCGDIQDEQLGDDSVRDAIQRAVKLTEHAQDPTGGWTYEPKPYGHEGSVTVTQVEALRAARNAGISVGRSCIDKGISYIKKSTAADGTIMYSLGGGGTGNSYALTAAGACVYAMYGLYEAPEAVKCLKALSEFIGGTRGRQGYHDYYSHLYAGQACFFMKQHNPKLWTDGYTKVRREILQQQDAKSGGWLQDGYNGAFGTACSTLVLQIPFRFLPIFQD